MADGRSNEDRLREANFIRVDSIEPEYQEVIDGLTDDEINVILDVQRRFEDADRARGWTPEAGRPPSLERFMVP
jgi:hypothetical protein